MNISLKPTNAGHIMLPLLLLAGEAALIAHLAGADVNPVRMFGFSATPAIASPATVTVPPNTFDYRPSGVFLMDDREIDAPLQTGELTAPLQIMRNQVSEDQYAACAAAGACTPADIRWRPTGKERPVTGVSHDDATRYAEWLTEQTGQNWHLPTNVEWLAAAGGRARDDAVGADGDGTDPSARWLEAYALQSEARAADGPPQPIGYFGANEFGLNDVSGNVWEWTDTCFSRTRLGGDGETLSVLETCGVRVVEGLHRTYISTFIRDAKAGGCSVGAPPSHLGFRLVLEPPRDIWQRVGDWLSGALVTLLPQP